MEENLQKIEAVLGEKVRPVLRDQPSVSPVPKIDDPYSKMTWIDRRGKIQYPMKRLWTKTI